MFVNILIKCKESDCYSRMGTRILLIDRSLALSRPDLDDWKNFDHTSAKGKLDDHYFGSIPTRALTYMRDLEQECMLLGIPVKHVTMK
jgi:glutamine synthetase type III